MPTRQVPRKRKPRRNRVRQDRRGAITTNPNTNITRKFIFQEAISLNNSTGSNTSYDAFKTIAMGSVQGFTTVARTFEQFRVRRIRTYLTSSLPLVNPGTSTSILFQNIARLPLNANPSTTVITAVDFTPNGIAGANIYGYNNAQFRIPDVDFATKIADYVPRITTTVNGDIVRPTNNFLACDGGDTVQWSGLQIRIVNQNGNLLNSVWSNPTYQQSFLLRHEITIEFKQPSLNAQTTLTPVLTPSRFLDDHHPCNNSGCPYPQCTLNEDESPMEVDDPL